MNKRIIAILLTVAGISGLSGLFASEQEIQGFKIRTPRTTGMGNAYIAIPKGAEALWTNPACFNADSTELTILGVNLSVLGKQSDLAKINTSSLSSGKVSDILNALEPVITGSGVGMEEGAGISWVGKRIGLGIYNSLNVYAQGYPFPAGTTGYIDHTVSLMGGYAHPFPITDDITISAGIAIRPSFKWRLNIDETFLNEALSSTDSSALVSKYMGTPMFGFPVDLGVRSTFKYGLSAAMTVKDLYTRYESSATSMTYVVPASFNLGGAWHPDLGDTKKWFDPTISLEISNLNKIVSGKSGFVRELHVGTELAFLRNFITVYAGLDGGYPALGTSLDLFIFDLSVAYGTTEFGRYLGDRPVSNLTVEVSFRID